jgi:hypothetical protein
MIGNKDINLSEAIGHKKPGIGGGGIGTLILIAVSERPFYFNKSSQIR